MRRVVVVAGDHALTRFIAEALLQRSLEAFVPRPEDPFDTARAHSGLEASVLLLHSPKPFDVLLVDQELPDMQALSLVARIREAGLTLPVVLITERGRDLHNRRVAVERHAVAGFLERPVSQDSLRHVIEMLQRRRRVMLIEPDVEVRESYLHALETANFHVDLAEYAAEALEKLAAARPDVAIAPLSLPDIPGLDLCALLKKRNERHPLPVILHGALTELPNQSLEDENAFRADDFLPAPFEPATLVERVTTQVGVSRPVPPAHTPVDPPDADPPRDQATYPRAPLSSLPAVSAPPPSASISSTPPTKRLTRRVPCHVELRVREGDRILHSKTLDISHGGIFFEMEPPLEIASVVDLHFELPGEQPVEAVGRVAWAGETGVGVKFSQIEKSDLQRIVEYVNRVARVLYNPS
ncbi:MAG: response regulator [Myxococcota bacterium]